LPEMGLHLANVQVVRSLAREFIEELDALPDSTLEASTALLQKHLVRIAEATDQQTRDQIYKWATEIASLGNRRQHFGWPWVLRGLAGVRGRDTPSVMPNISRDKLEAIARVINDRFRDELDLDDRIDQAEALPKSSWETKVYARSDGSWSPLAGVRGGVTEYRFRLAWTGIVEILSNEEVDELVRWAKSQAPKFNLRPEMLERPRLQRKTDN
jgi:hypothetical protein